jgi:hypothetical protein
MTKIGRPDDLQGDISILNLILTRVMKKGGE